MLSIAEIQRWATIVPAHVATAVVLFVAAAVTVVCGLLRSRPAMRLWLPGVAFVTLSAATMWPLSSGRAEAWLRGVLLGTAGISLLAHALIREKAREESPVEAGAGTRASGWYLVIATVVAGVFLFYNLSGYSGNMLLTWEASVVHSFGKAFVTGQSVASFTSERFLWDDGLLSGGDTSLFFGAPTYALLRTVGFSPWTLRCAAALATLLSIVLAYAVGRRFFGQVAGAAMALAFASNPCVLFYGRYGSSPAGTVFAVLLALLATWLFLDREQSALLCAAGCGTALYLATLQYSPGRIVVLVLLGFIPVGLAYQWRRVGWRRVTGFAVIVLMAIGVWYTERSFQRHVAFLRARGETFFSLLRSPAYVSSLYGGKAPPHIRPQALSVRDKIELLGRALRITVPEYRRLLLPALAPPARGEVINGDPPPLQIYYGPVAVFIVLGLADSLRSWRSWPRSCLLLWIVLGTVPLLLTNRVDAHRMMLFVVPLSFLAALGVRDASRVMDKATVPQALRHVLAGGLALSAVYSAVNVLEYERPPQSGASRALAAETASIPGPVLLGVNGMQRELGWVYLKLLERERQDPRRTGRLLEGIVFEGIQPALGEPAESHVRELQRLSTTATVLLAPADDFQRVAAALERKGVRVMERGIPEFHILRLDGGVKSAEAAGEEIEALPPPVLTPSPRPPPPVHLREGPKRLLTGLEPTAVTFGFQPPKVDANWNGGPIRMGGVTYEHGLGTHAWCRMTYPVPLGATAFQAIVGLSDDTRWCDRAAVTFEIHDDHDKALYDSGLVGTTTPPQAVYVKLGDTRTITLVVTEGGNGRDCDHALWALPGFLLHSK